MSQQDADGQREDVAERRSAEVAFGAAERLTFFSDAVVAIAVTLLALNLPVPKGGTAAAILADLHSHWHAYLAFGISFLVTARYWSSHHSVFRYLREMDRPLLWLNLLWLFVMVLMPWLTDVLAGDQSIAQMPSGNALRYSMYAAGQVVANALFAGMVALIHHHRLDHGDLPTRDYRISMDRTVAVAVGFALSIPVFFLWSDAWILWIAIPTAIGLGRRAVERRTPRTRVRAPQPNRTNERPPSG